MHKRRSGFAVIQIQRPPHDAVVASDEVKIVVFSEKVERIQTAELIPPALFVPIPIDGSEPVVVHQFIEGVDLRRTIECEPFIELIVRNLIKSFDARAVS